MENQLPTSQLEIMQEDLQPQNQEEITGLIDSQDHTMERNCTIKDGYEENRLSSKDLIPKDDSVVNLNEDSCVLNNNSEQGVNLSLENNENTFSTVNLVSKSQHTFKEKRDPRGIGNITKNTPVAHLGKKSFGPR